MEDTRLDLPKNQTAKLQEKGIFDDMYQRERAILGKYIDANRDSLYIQATCDMNCKDCPPIMVLDCWLDNKAEALPYEED